MPGWGSEFESGHYILMCGHENGPEVCYLSDDGHTAHEYAPPKTARELFYADDRQVVSAS